MKKTLKKLVRRKEAPIVALAVVLVGCGIAYALSQLWNRTTNAENALREKGYSDVVIDGRYLMCMRQEVGSHFTAKASAGQAVKGHICNAGFYSRISVD
jgi:hypothetical protein